MDAILAQLLNGLDKGGAYALIALGLVKKVVIADFLARSIVDPVFAVPEAYGAPDAWAALFSYAVQLLERLCMPWLRKR